MNEIQKRNCIRTLQANAGYLDNLLDELTDSFVDGEMTDCDEDIFVDIQKLSMSIKQLNKKIVKSIDSRTGGDWR